MRCGGKFALSHCRKVYLPPPEPGWCPSLPTHNLPTTPPHWSYSSLPIHSPTDPPRSQPAPAAMPLTFDMQPSHLPPSLGVPPFCVWFLYPRCLTGGKGKDC